MAERARQVQERFEQRQSSTSEALEQLLALVAQNEQRLRQQAAIGFDGLTYFVYRSLLDAQISNAEAVSATIKAAFVAHPNWRSSEKALRELRQKVTFALVAECDTLEPVTPIEYSFVDLGENPLRCATTVVDGTIGVPDQPGLGADPDAGALGRCTID
jgi:type I restriction enzyme R subunit